MNLFILNWAVVRCTRLLWLLRRALGMLVLVSVGMCVHVVQKRTLSLVQVAGVVRCGAAGKRPGALQPIQTAQAPRAKGGVDYAILVGGGSSTLGARATDGWLGIRSWVDLSSRVRMPLPPHNRLVFGFVFRPERV